MTKLPITRRDFLKAVGLSAGAIAGAAYIGSSQAGCNKAANVPAVVLNFRRAVKSKDIKVYSEAALALRKWMIENDTHYPKYHFTGPESWINDPNGPIYCDGKYHLFYQFDPMVDDCKGGWRRNKRCWGHAVSKDLVHWEDWPVALWPDTPYDRNGVFSGNTFIDTNGDLCALYTGNVAGHKETYGILARSTDGGLTWQKKRVMDNSQRPNADSPVHWDGYVWKDGDIWYQLIGGTSGGENHQGAAMLWTSSDLVHWSFRKNIAPSIRLGGFWELPYLIRLDGRDILMVGHQNSYWVGRYHKNTMLFTPDTPQPKSIDTGNYYSFNLNMVEKPAPGSSPRQLMHGWVTGPQSPTTEVPYWQGAHSIPRVIRLAEDRIWQEPIPEIKMLRGKHYYFDDIKTADSNLRNLRNDALEIQAVVQPSSTRAFGFKLRVSDDGKDFARVFYDTTTGHFGVDGPTISRNAKEMRDIAINRQNSFLNSAEEVTLRIFLDRSIIEVFTNGVAYTARVFAAADALGIEVFSDGGELKLKTLDIWQIKTIWS